MSFNVKNLIQIIPDRCKVRVLCDSRDKGKIVRENCRAGCLACNICQKVCKLEAIKVEDNVARIDHEKCNLCMDCVAKCPSKVIKIIS